MLFHKVLVQWLRIVFSIIKSTARNSNKNECIFHTNGSTNWFIFQERSSKEYYLNFIKAPEEYKILKEHFSRPMVNPV